MSDAAETPPEPPAADVPAATEAPAADGLNFTCLSCGHRSAIEGEQHPCWAADRPAIRAAPATSRIDPTDFLYDWQRLATFVERCRAAGLKTFEHPTGLRFSFEQTPKMPIRPTEGW